MPFIDRTIINNFEEQKQNIELLNEKLGELTQESKNVAKNIQGYQNAYESYYKGNGTFIDGLLRRSGDVKKMFKELEELTKQQSAAMVDYETKVNSLANAYNEPKEKVAETLKLLGEYQDLQKKIEETSGNEKKYLEEKKELLEKKLGSEKERNKFTKELFNLYEKGDEKIKNAVNSQKKFKETTEECSKAQNKLNNEIEKGEALCKAYANSGLKEIGNAFLGVAKIGVNTFKDIDQASRDFGRSMGMGTEDLNKHVTGNIKNYQDMALKLGMEFKDMYKFQVGYAEATSKAVMLTTEQVGTMAALSRNTGEEAVSVASKNLDIFATSADATIEYLAKGSSRAALEGLNVKKYSEAFANNIKMASKYTFKQGITGIEKMTLLSQRLKFNMESIGAAMDKFSSIEGAIEASAKIQVLGGSFAQNFANPLEAMSQALLDAEGFTNKIIDTVASQAMFDKKTGEINVSALDKQRLKQYADALGISFDEIFNMTTQSRKASLINSVVGDKFNDEEKAYLANKAQYNAETGKWQLTDVNGEVKYDDISKMTSKQLNEIRNVDTHEKLISSNVADIKKHLLENATEQKGLAETQKGIMSAIQMKLGEFVDDILNWLGPWAKTLLAGVMALGGLSVGGMALGALKGGYQFVRGGGKGLVNAWKGFRGVGSGASVAGSRGASGYINTATGRSVSKEAASRYLKMGGDVNKLKPVSAISKAGKFVKVGGGLLTTAIAGYEIADAVSDYKSSKEEIISSNKSNEEKARALNDAKKSRNKSVGGAIGGAGVGLAVGAALMATGVGFIPGAIIAGISGLAGSIVGKKVGEAVTETTGETLKEIKGDEENKENIINGDDGILVHVKSINNYAHGINTKVNNLYDLMVLRANPSSNLNNIRNGKYENSSKIQVSDIKVNVGGHIKIVGDTSSKNSIDIDALMRNESFKTGIANIIRDKIKETAGGKKVE